MKKLKKQVFLVIFLILTLFTTGIFCAYNLQLYRREMQTIERVLNQSTRLNEEKPKTPLLNSKLPEESNNKDKDAENMRFIGGMLYTVTLDGNGNITEVKDTAGNAPEDMEALTAVATEFWQSGESRTVDNLYMSNYAFARVNDQNLQIMDTAAVKSTLRHTLIYSLWVCLLLEIAVLLLAILLTLRITRPVSESFEKQKQFVADASHELKTPLAVIMASADALESNPTETKWLTNIKSEADRMNRLVADLLELAKSEAMAENAAFSEGNLSKTVETAMLTFEGVLFENGIALEDSIESDIRMEMDGDKIKQLLSILLDNAIKHSQPNGTVTVKLKKDKDIILTVTNEGEGIPKGEEDKIFERFYRADAARNRNENRYGLGLAIAKNIAELHNGHIAAKSENGKTTFKVVFKTK